MDAEYCNEPPRSSEEEDELGRSFKKFKESGGESKRPQHGRISVIRIVLLEIFQEPISKLLS